jgi:ABC-type transporter Mla subunit MlaD
MSNTIRVSNTRKQITDEIRSLQKILTTLNKAKTTIDETQVSLSDPTFHQIHDVFAKLGMGITVCEAAIEERGKDLARTYTR